MSLTNFPNGVSGWGMPLVGSGVPVTGGQYFWVKSSTGQNAPGNGISPDNPFASIDYAVGRCTAGRQDVILVMPGHVETVSAAGGLDLDVSGIYVWGLGTGALRPTINLGTVDTASIQIDAANVTLHNCIIDATGVDGIDIVFDVNSTYFTLQNCHVVLGDSGGQADDGISTAAAAASTGFRVLNNVFDGGGTTGPVSAIDIVGTPDNWQIVGNVFRGTYSGAPIDNETGNIATNGLIAHNFIENIHATGIGIDLDSACTGTIAYNTVWTPNVDPAGAGVSIDGGSMACFENYAGDTVDTSGLLEPVVVT